MRILLIASAYNSMTQRVHAELADRGYEVSVELALGDEVMRDGVGRYDPDLVIAPMLTTAIPADIWSARPCLIVHPGPRGDRGSSSLDWAIMGGAERWGVTVLQANAEMDAGDIWASVEFEMPGCSKSSAYRTEVADAAARAVLLAVARFAGGRCRPEPLDYGRPGVTGRWRPPCRQADRRIDWPTEPTEAVLAKLRAADSSPGVLDEISGTQYYLIGGHPEDELRGPPGTILARREGAICRATSDGAVWIPQLRRRPVPGGPATFKLPATLALRESLDGSLDGVPEVLPPLTLPPGRRTYRPISYRESGTVGYVEFCFPGGAMSTGQCRRLLAAYRHAQTRPVKVIVLGGPRDFFANGIHLNVIQAGAAGPQPGLPGAAERQGPAARGGREAASAGRLPRRGTGHHEPQLLRPARTVRPPAPGLRLQGEAIAHPTPPRPAPDPTAEPPKAPRHPRACPCPGRGPLGRALQNGRP